MGQAFSRAHPEALYANVPTTGNNLMATAPGYRPEMQKFSPLDLALLGKTVSDYGYWTGKQLADAQSPEAAQAAKDFYANAAMQGQISRGGVRAVPKVGRQFVTNALSRGVASGIDPRSSISSGNAMDTIDLQNLALMNQAAQNVAQVPAFAQQERARYQSEIGMTPSQAIASKQAVDAENVNAYNQYQNMLQQLAQNIAGQDVSAGLMAGRSSQEAGQQQFQNLLGLGNALASMAGSAAKAAM